MPAPFTRQSVSERALARVGTTVQGKYRIDRLLGIGGTAAVYAATHRNGHRVAIKFLLDHLLDDSDLYQLFSREAYVANRVGHPGAVQVLDDDEDVDGCVFLIMPLIEGETLRARWERGNKRLPLAEVGVLIADLLDVLATAHAKGVVHRDIKPENLFVNTAAQMRVLDFGIARRTGADSTLTMTGRFIGTPAFMPPEQALGNRNAIGPHSDLWAVGATMFALLSGETVHLAEHSGAQLAAAATQHARSIAKVLPDLAPAMVRFIDKALQFEPLERWPSALCMREALCLALEESLGEKCDAIAARVRESIVAEFVAKAAERGTSDDELTEPSPRAPDLRSGPSRRTPRGNQDLMPDSVGRTALEGSDPRVKEVSSGPRHVTPRETGDSGSMPRAPQNEGEMSPVVHDTGSGRSESFDASQTEPSERGAIARRRGRLAAAATWLVVIGVAGVAGAGAMRKCGGIGDGTGMTASFGASTPTSKNPDSQAALEAGLQLWKDASTVAARAKFGEAAQKDSGLAVAHLYFAAVSDWFDPDVRTHFAEAQSLRRRLTGMQASLLDALEPLTREPADYNSTTLRLKALTEKYPNEEVAWFVRGAHALRTRDAAGLLSIVDRIPGSIAFAQRARALLMQGDVEGARKSLHACMAAQAQGGMDCMFRSSRIEANEGSCDSAAAAARRLIATDHASPEGYRYLARTEYGRSHRTNAVRAILEERWSRLAYPRDELERDREQWHLAVLDGDFEQAYRLLDALDKSSLATVDGLYRVLPLAYRVDLDLELGRVASAQLTARKLVDASQTWLTSEASDSEAEGTRVLYLSGLLDRDEFRRRTARDEEAIIARGGGFQSPHQRWMEVYGQSIRDEEDARFALAHLPADRPIIDAEYSDVLTDASLGRIYLLAGELDKSLESFSRATKSCLFSKSMSIVPAHAWYGDALAKSNRPRESCEQYKFVLERWGRDARSLTARAAHESALRLGCPGVTGPLSPNADKGVTK